MGANPISDIWAEEALRLVGRYLRRAVLNPHDLEARAGMSRAATFAGLGFGNAGTHIPHACAYPIAGLVRDYRPPGYEVGHAMVPHGSAVVSTAAAAFAFTYPTAPERHLRAAELLGANLAGVTAANGADALPAALTALVADTGGPPAPRSSASPGETCPRSSRARSSSKGCWCAARAMSPTTTCGGSWPLHW
ncbi:iron-containing alcohol dehydrogenase [Streptomyces stramineus]